MQIDLHACRAGSEVLIGMNKLPVTRQSTYPHLISRVEYTFERVTCARDLCTRIHKNELTALARSLSRWWCSQQTGFAPT